MKATTKVSVFTKQNNDKWEWPINRDAYDKSFELTDMEKSEISFVTSRSSKWHSKTHKILERLLQPLNDALLFTKAPYVTNKATIRVIIAEMNKRSSSFWSWSEPEWNEIFGKNTTTFSLYYKTPGDCRSYLIAVVYLICGFHTHRPGSSGICSYSVATKVFGRELVDTACERIVEAYLNLGYGKDRAKTRLKVVLCDAILANRSPYLEDLTIEFLENLRCQKEIPQYVRTDLVATSCALVSLGILSQPLARKVKEGERFGNHDATANISSEWKEYCQRWHETSTLSPNTKQHDYYQLLKVGRWLAQKHPDIISPEQWTRSLAIEFIAAVDKMNVGEWANATKSYADKIGKPLSPRCKDGLIGSLRRFIRDCQEWGWIPRRLSPERALATPGSIRNLISPNPRVIADDIWAKLLWAGLNLNDEDLPCAQYQDFSNRVPWYPLEMVKAIVIVWLFSGLRSNEIYRLRVGCVRWQKNDIVIPGTNEVVPKDAVCYLDVPVHKTGTAYTKPVDRLIGEAIEVWEKVRPNQPYTIDNKDGSVANYLFFNRGRKVGISYINDSIIPMLCRKAGVPDLDARGNITSHRARSTIASQLANAKEPMTLFELKEWLGHRDVNSTINYTKISPTRLAKSYQDAEYFKQNIRTIEVLIDQDAVKTGAAASGEPWMFYDLGHGYCTYDFFDQCKHRMACAKCSFYLPKNSTSSQLLESKANLQRMLQEIPLSEEERSAVEDGMQAMNKLLAKLASEPTPEGKTPQQLEKL